MTKNSTKYVTATDITPNRCTVTGVYSSEQAAQAAIEGDEEQGCFEYLATADGEVPAEGARIYHRDGECWLFGQRE